MALPHPPMIPHSTLISAVLQATSETYIHVWVMIIIINDFFLHIDNQGGGYERLSMAYMIMTLTQMQAQNSIILSYPPINHYILVCWFIIYSLFVCLFICWFIIHLWIIIIIHYNLFVIYLFIHWSFISNLSIHSFIYFIQHLDMKLQSSGR